jgi:hypothetical protein
VAWGCSIRFGGTDPSSSILGFITLESGHESESVEVVASWLAHEAYHAEQQGLHWPPDSVGEENSAYTVGDTVWQEIRGTQTNKGLDDLQQLYVDTGSFESHIRRLDAYSYEVTELDVNAAGTALIPVGTGNRALWWWMGGPLPLW